MRNLVVGQSGGPTAVINATLAGVLHEAIQEKRIGKIFGMTYGVEGFLKEKLIELQEFTEEEIELLKTTPASYLGSCRFKLPADMEDSVYDKIFEGLEKKKIGYFLYIGGNDSMDTVSKLSKQAKKRGSDIVFLGVPKTVDNDLVLTDHTPGFGSSAKFIANSVRNVVADTDAYDMKSVTIIEIMGRHAGWLTGAAALARRYEGDNPLLIYLPEMPFVEDEFLEDVRAALEKRGSVVICVSEGIKDERGKLVCENGSSKLEDGFGHKLLSGSAVFLENLVRDKIGVKVRSFNPGLTQRSASQSLSKTDVEEAYMAGEFAVKQAMLQESGKMVSFVREKGETYKVHCSLQDVDLICNQEKTVPSEWITENDVKKEFINYVRPLIMGEIYPPMEEGVAKFLMREKR